jgi:hypothetical protein
MNREWLSGSDSRERRKIIIRAAEWWISSSGIFSNLNPGEFPATIKINKTN